ncbi:MAG: CDP-2,3-bis-(O-geranylgeranyl)-sn-glycerol synthase [Methanobacteriaceae archaeon]|nr:CDP-2,3-bis-(O-geranylgeranyl)-sn-glycerol synthase [Methanobacteriaceae archaeon]
MDPSVFSVLILSAYAIYFMLPAYLANASALTFGGGTPLDMGRSLKDGRRLLGDGVTWKGTVIGIFIGTVIGLVQGILTGDMVQNLLMLGDPATGVLLQGTISSNALAGALLGLALGSGAIIGDACGSFLKRRFKVERGRPVPLMDQLDFVVGALVFASLIITIPFNLIIFIIIISLFLHLGANIIAYLLGMKNVWY